jgi:translation initiation factor IF-3
LNYTASYTTRSNGAAFLNNLDFLAPAPSQPRPFQQTNNKTQQQRLQSPQSINKRNTTGSLPLADSLDDLLDDIGTKDPPKKPLKRATAADNDRNAGHQGNNNTRPVLDRPRRDEEIDSLWVQYISSEGNQGEKRLSSVLKSFDRSQYFLVEVGANGRIPICKLFSKKELYEKAKAAKQAKKANELSTKELQLNWGTDNNDLNHKLSKFRAFLEKGHRLEIQINGKKGKNTTPQEREAVMERVKAEFEPVSKYVKQPEWVKATTVTMLLQGTSKKVEKERKQQQS